MKKVLMVTMNKYPHQDAGGEREYAFTKLFCGLDSEVTVVSMGESTGYKVEEIETNVKHISFKGSRTHKVFKLLDYLMYPFRLKGVLKKERFDVCLYTELDPLSRRILKKSCLKNRTVLLFDAVEWYSPEEFSNGEKNYFYKQNNLYNTKYVDDSEKVIAISRYLESNFSKRGIESLRVPVILDVLNTSCEKDDYAEDKVRVIYAGSPGKKDKLSTILEGIGKLPAAERSRLEFIILGCSKDELVLENPELKSLLPEIEANVKIMGRVDRKKVLDYYKESDFSVFARASEQRYAMAGFPTKFAESMSTATPVICNYSSDLKEYLISDENGVIIEDLTADAIAAAFEKILGFDRKKLSEMQIEARKTAEKCFDYRVYTDDIKAFVGF